jgi:dipeptidyl aminopeptidase/acylaminoacyl peptidase
MTGLGWVKPGDPRSELVLSLFKESHGLNIMLNGLTSDGSWMRQPSPERVAYISPMAQVRSGTYNTPTFIIHGERDEIVPVRTAVKFVNALEKHNIEHGFLLIPNVKHIHDLNLKPGMEEWYTQVEPGYNFLLKALEIL